MTVLKSIVACLVLANLGYFLWLDDIAQPAAVPSPAGAGGTLKLASEVPTLSQPPNPTAEAESAAATGGAASAGAAPATPTSALRCVTVGPFKDVAEAAHAASTLRAAGYDPRQRVVDGDVWAGVWVYLALPATHPASDQLLAKLKAAGIDDSLLMPGPTDSSVVSLGLFSEPKRAQARIAQVQALGLTPGVVDRKRTASLYWIDLDLKPTDGPLNPEDLQGETGRINRLEVLACPAAAS